MTPPTDQSERFETWGREHAPSVRGYLLAMVRRNDVADDLTQEVFARAWQARSRYREQGAARAYLFRIADRLVIDRARNAGRRNAGREVNLNEESWKQVEPTGDVPEPYQAVANAEAARALNEALDRLSPAQRRVLLMRYFGQLTFAAIAEIVECPLSTVLSHCRRGLKTLRELLVEDNL